MLVEEFLEPKIHIVSGKGGVGKTTVSAALALVAARQSRRVCIAEVDRKGGVPSLFGGGALRYEPSEIAPGVWGINIAPEDALAEYLRVQYHIHRMSRVLTHSHFIDYITTAAPGLKDILVLGKVWYLEQGPARGGTRHRFDTIVVDAPASGHMKTFLSAPAGLSDAVRVGPVRRQADWILAMLRDPRRTRVHLVTLAEEMPVAETLETSQAIRGGLRMTQGITFANAILGEILARSEERKLDELSSAGDLELLVGCGREVGLHLDNEDLGALGDYASFLRSRRQIQARYIKTLRKDSDASVVELPFLFSPGLALPDVENLADVIEERIAKL
jgi:anion-transporting  ArsA/GET3 family ATPase